MANIHGGDYFDLGIQMVALVDTSADLLIRSNG